jgi:hypothetical protein
VPPTALVETGNVALALPAGTVTVARTLAGSVPDNTTSAPPAGALPVRVAVPVTGFPPTTLDALSTIEDSVTACEARTVSTEDCRLAPFKDAVIVIVPVVNADTVNVALDAPAAMVTAGATVATAGLLLDSDTLIPPADAAPVSVTLPCVLPPGDALVAFSATPDTVAVGVGAVADPEPLHRINVVVTSRIAASVVSGAAGRLMVKRISLL